MKKKKKKKKPELTNPGLGLPYTKVIDLDVTLYVSISGVYSAVHYHSVGKVWCTGLANKKNAVVCYPTTMLLLIFRRFRNPVCGDGL